MDSLNNLRDSLDYSSSRPPGGFSKRDEVALTADFKAAALHLTTLYRTSLSTSKRVYSRGYLAALSDLLDMIALRARGNARGGRAEAMMEDALLDPRSSEQQHQAGPSSLSASTSTQELAWMERYLQGRIEALKGEAEDEEIEAAAADQAGPSMDARRRAPSRRSRERELSAETVSAQETPQTSRRQESRPAFRRQSGSENAAGDRPVHRPASFGGTTSQSSSNTDLFQPRLKRPASSLSSSSNPELIEDPQDLQPRESASAPAHVQPSSGMESDAASVAESASSSQSSGSTAAAGSAPSANLAESQMSFATPTPHPRRSDSARSRRSSSELGEVTLREQRSTSGDETLVNVRAPAHCTPTHLPMTPSGRQRKPTRRGGEHAGKSRCSSHEQSGHLLSPVGEEAALQIPNRPRREGKKRSTFGQGVAPSHHQDGEPNAPATAGSATNSFSFFLPPPRHSLEEREPKAGNRRGGIVVPATSGNNTAFAPFASHSPEQATRAKRRKRDKKDGNGNANASGHASGNGDGQSLI
ncbi:hypothetical protein IE81DRAFT_325094 [Ceraceosorus guamensis]|uniref:Uncharacterized protein n=1 Tax=Ceraceosorus guamensis TaxID=1522189 RepID=A0A316VTT4_9BASI|nr:hypothetical protein IE81DRAFT_325094 [Ceraceosorus guamensis]PWN40912.1 hypothetical protein IE81DRAFT_325094 [Ceraceosorus guamensis]